MFDTEKTKLFMTASALYMALIGITTLFLPQEILVALQASAGTVTVMAVKIVGALYVGLAALDWTARANIMGGIYSRPVALCNCTFLYFGRHDAKTVVSAFLQFCFWIVTLINIFFASGFGYLLFFSGRKS